MALLPPIIDNTIGAFENIIASGSNSVKMPIKLYFQENDDTDEFQTNLVAVTVEQDGIPVLDAGIIVCNTSLITDPSSIYKNFANLNQYSISISATALKSSYCADRSLNGNIISGYYFAMNKPFTVKVATLHKDISLSREGEVLIGSENTKKSIYDFINSGAYSQYYSAWSASVVKYAIPKIDFTLYGGLSSEEIVSPSGLVNAASKRLNQNSTLIFPYDAYRIGGHLRFIDIGAVQQSGEWASKDVLSIEKEDDRIMWYQVQLVEEQIAKGQVTYVLLDSTEKREYIDYIWDESKDGRSFVYTFNYDLANRVLSLPSSKVLNLQLIVTFVTRKGYTFGSVYYLSYSKNNEIIAISAGSGPNLDIQTKLSGLTIDPINEKGGIFITCRAASNKNFAGTFTLQRAVDHGEEQALNYQTIYKELISSTNKSALFVYLDQSADSGVPYRYRIFMTYEQIKGATGSTDTFYAVNSSDLSSVYLSNEGDTNAALLMIDDIFLTSKTMTLKIRYNPELTGYKRNIIDTVTPTLGGAYPFIRRNGAQKYKTFTLGGLISYHGDELDDGSHLFFNKGFATDFNIAVSSYNNFKGMSYYQAEQIKEKMFREQVMAFLYSDDIMMFKSFQEGTMFIRLTNVQLSSDKKLGRNIYTFTAQAVEVIEASAQNITDFFSKKSEDIDFILTRIYLQAAQALNSEAFVIDAADFNELDDEEYTLTIVNSVMYYAIVPNADINNDAHWTSVISPSYTYYSESGQKVPVVKGNNNRYSFKPGYMPYSMVKDITSRTQTYKGSAVNLYYQPYTFD